MDRIQIRRHAVFNPSIGEVIAECPVGTVADVNAAVEAAQAAFPGVDGNAAGRTRADSRPVQMLLDDNFEDLVRSNTREHGKTLAESRGDVKRGMEVVEFALGVPSLMMGEVLENVARGIDCEAIRQPLGVCAGITPFNFPAMVPLWMYPIAIACGNTFVLKPSEKVPLTAIKIARLLEKAGLPKGVLNIVHGGREVVDALLTHPKVKAISFVGSTPVAQIHLRSRNETRQTRPVQRRREKLRHHHARCRRGKFHARRHRSRVWLRGRTLHGRFHRGRRRRRGQNGFAVR
jgi:malonate-semialdehyde dehydrogenase (acetylating) / methylmalonate-semialdehyde dehydrogenase